MAVKIGEPHVYERPSGWYVRVVTLEGVSTAGPTDEKTARAILKDIQDEMRKTAN